MIDTILSALPALSSNELDRVYKGVCALRSLSGAPIQDREVHTNTDEDMVLDCIVSQLASKGIEKVPVFLLKNYRGISDFRDKLPIVLDYLVRSRLSKIEKKAVLMIGMDELYKFLISRKNMRVVSARTMMMNIHWFPAAVEAQFPDYAKIGWLGILLTTAG